MGDSNLNIEVIKKYWYADVFGVPQNKFKSEETESVSRLTKLIEFQ